MLVKFVVVTLAPTGSPCVRATSAPNDHPKAVSGRGGGADVWNVHAAEDETPRDVQTISTVCGPPEISMKGSNRQMPPLAETSCVTMTPSSVIWTA